MFKKSTNQVELLKNRSLNAISVFDKTKKELKDINQSISEEKQTRENEISRLKAELTSLDVQSAANSKVISKIEDFLGE